jgi:hypothetical protein
MLKGGDLLLREVDYHVHGPTPESDVKSAISASERFGVDTTAIDEVNDGSGT